MARASYVDQPSDTAERKRRFLQYRAQDLRDQIATTRALAEAGFDVDPDTSEQEREFAEIGDVGTFPDDARLMKKHLGFAPYYARVFRLASDHVHFSQRVALEAVSGEEDIGLDAGDPALADEALGLALITFGELLSRSERAVGHGLTERVAELVRAAIP